ACAAHDVPVWCGGMLETGIGRAANVALAALPNFQLPGDTSASARYFAEDVTEPFVLEDGHLAVPSGPGIGREPDERFLERITVSAHEVRVGG
ncbi:MAG: o-succinylbenzoate synthase, partial [Actinobacteria bacterium]|nr:o-succinylbenzoate synthase [Actinomycetota bacterium]